MDLDASEKQNLKSIARRLQRGVDDVVVVLLDRAPAREADRGHSRGGGANRLISDGKLSTGIAANNATHD